MGDQSTRARATPCQFNEFDLGELNPSWPSTVVSVVRVTFAP